MHRIFLGIAVDDAVRAHCGAVAARIEASGVRAKPVAAENYHLTLFFFGNVADERITEIDAATRTVASRHKPFTIVLDRVGAFPHERKPRIIFLGSRGVDAAYRQLAKDIRESCARLAFVTEGKDDVAHVTLARVPERTRAALPLLDVEPLSIDVSAVTLFESLPYDGRTRYEVRSAFTLGSPI